MVIVSYLDATHCRKSEWAAVIKGTRHKQKVKQIPLKDIRPIDIELQKNQSEGPLWFPISTNRFTFEERHLPWAKLDSTQYGVVDIATACLSRLFLALGGGARPATHF